MALFRALQVGLSTPTVYTQPGPRSAFSRGQVSICARHREGRQEREENSCPPAAGLGLGSLGLCSASTLAWPPPQVTR